MFQILKDRAFQVKLSNSSSREREVEKERGNIYDQTTKSVAREKASVSHMEKDIEVL